MIKKVSILIYITLFYVTAFAQKKDDVNLFKQYITISNKYQVPPLLVNITHTKTSNAIEGKADTVVEKGIFVVSNPTNAYVKFGNLEQIVMDTIVVMVAKDMKRIMVYEGSKEQMQGKMLKLGIAEYNDSVYKHLAEKYSISDVSGQVNEGIMTLNSKTVVAGTSMVKETISVRYNKTTSEPIELISVKRGLKRLNEKTLKQLPLSDVISIEKKGNYWLYCETERFVFDNIQHPENLVLPFITTDRVIKNIYNEYQPVKGFEGFIISKH